MKARRTGNFGRQLLFNWLRYTKNSPTRPMAEGLTDDEKPYNPKPKRVLSAEEKQQRREALAEKVRQSYIDEHGEKGSPEDMAQHGREAGIVNVKDAARIRWYYDA